MPMISETQLRKLQGAMERTRSAGLRARQKAEEKADEMMSVVQSAGAAGGVGFLRGKMERPDGSWNVPGTTIDWELVIGLAGVGAVFFDLFGKWDPAVLNMSNGVLSHYTGQVARKWGKTGTFSLVAGSDAVGDYLPPYVGDPTSYNPTQISSPYGDPSDIALSRAGV